MARQDWSRVDDRTRRIVRIMLADGHDHSAIRARLGLSRSTVSHLVTEVRQQIGTYKPRVKRAAENEKSPCKPVGAGSQGRH